MDGIDGLDGAGHGDPMGELYTAFNTDADGGVDVTHGLSSWSDGDEYDDDPFLSAPAAPDAPEEPDDVWQPDAEATETFDDDDEIAPSG